MGNAASLYFRPEITPRPDVDPSFDPNLGFPNGRKERVMIATEAEMVSAKLPLDERDYCAHKKIEHLACQADVWPFAYKCAHSKHEVLNCLYEDYVLRMKEYERERRLMMRRERKAKRQQVQFLEA